MKTKSSVLESVGLLLLFGLSPILGQPESGPAPQSNSNNTTVTINDSRPLSRAADVLEQKLHISISYEDAAWVWKGDQIQAADHPANQQTVAKIPGWRGPVIPIGGTVEVTFPARYEPQLSADPLSILERVLNDYSARNNPGKFRVVQYGASRFSIVPAQARDVVGNMVPHSSPFDTRISFPVTERSRLETILVIFKAITDAAHYRMSNGPVGGRSRPLSASRVQIGAANEIARNVLAETLSGSGKYSWRLFFDPATNAYVFNLHQIPQLPLLTVQINT